jgi:cardiolipin synthase
MQPTSWKTYTGTREAWDSMLEACRGARVSIDLEQFIIDNDAVGGEFISICRDRAKSGVKVRIIADAAGSFGLYGSFLPSTLLKDGVEIIFFNPLLIGSRTRYTTWFYRDHRKLLIVDGTIGFTGGICLAEETEDWRDTHVRIEGEVVGQMQYTFEWMWARARKVQSHLTRVGGAPDGWSYETNAPNKRRRYLYKRYIEAIRHAENFIYVTTPYFVPDRRLLRVLKLAARRGVDVRILLPHHSDHKVVDLAARSYFTRLLKAGVKIYLYKETMLHAKTMTVDGTWATVGSMNLDYASLMYNFEANLVATDRGFARELRDQFLADLEKSEEITAGSWKRRFFPRKALEYLVIPLRKFL